MFDCKVGSVFDWCFGTPFPCSPRAGASKRRLWCVKTQRSEIHHWRRGGGFEYNFLIEQTVYCRSEVLWLIALACWYKQNRGEIWWRVMSLSLSCICGNRKRQEMSFFNKCSSRKYLYDNTTLLKRTKRDCEGNQVRH